MFYDFLLLVAFATEAVCCDIPLHQVAPTAQLPVSTPVVTKTKFLLCFKSCFVLSMLISGYRFCAMARSFRFCHAFLWFSRTVVLITSLNTLIICKDESRPSVMPPLALPVYPPHVFHSHYCDRTFSSDWLFHHSPGQHFMAAHYDQLWSYASCSFILCLGCQSRLPALQSVWSRASLAGSFILQRFPLVDATSVNAL